MSQKIFWIYGINIEYAAAWKETIAVITYSNDKNDSKSFYNFQRTQNVVNSTHTHTQILVTES